MTVMRLALTDFRSYADALIAPGPGFVVLTGENGAGKTNILEAVSMLAPGRGLRRAALSEMARDDGAGGFSVAARLLQHPFVPSEVEGRGDALERVSTSLDTNGVGGVSAAARFAQPSPFVPSEVEGRGEAYPSPSTSLDTNGVGQIDLGTGTTPQAPERRQVRINGAQASASALAEWLSILWLTPAMDRIFTEGASGRRRFLDRLVLALHPGHAVHTTRYDAAMRARTKLLTGDAPPDPAWLSALESQMAEHGAAVAAARADTVAALGERLAAVPAGPFARAGLALEGGAPGDLSALRGRDAAAGRATAGPHRTDLVVTHLGKGQPAERCSTGEQKALLLGIVLAHADLVAERVARRPILLLDEVAAHLDPLRRAALFERLETGGGQVWMTGTEDALFTELSSTASRFKIAAGMIISG